MRSLWGSVEKRSHNCVSLQRHEIMPQAGWAPVASVALGTSSAILAAPKSRSCGAGIDLQIMQAMLIIVSNVHKADLTTNTQSRLRLSDQCCDGTADNLLSLYMFHHPGLPRAENVGVKHGANSPRSPLRFRWKLPDTLAAPLGA